VWRSAGLCTGGAINELEFQKSVLEISCDMELVHYGLYKTEDVLTLALILRWINIVLPLLNSFFIALNSLWVPGTKYLKLSHTMVLVESEIFKCRTR
jgi:hypothetical protein